jgi:hypothetical protein
MEKAPHISEETESSAESTSNKKRRSVREVVRDWLYYREFGSISQSEYENDQEEGTDKKKKKSRFRQFFKGLFKEEVTKEPVVANAASERVAEAPLLSQFVELQETQAPERDEPTVALAPEQVSDKIDTPPSLELPTPEVPAATRSEVVVPLHTQAENIVPERFEQSSPVTIEHRSNKTALAGIEQRGRNRDKKQQREINQNKEELARVKELQQQTADELQVETDRARRMLQEKRIEAPFVVPVVETVHSLPTPEYRRTEQQPAPQSVKEILAKRHVEHIPTPVEQRAERLARTHYEQLQPETVLNEVKEVSEKNVALEGLFELRHEAKDENDFTARQSSTQGGRAGSDNNAHQMTSVNPNSTLVDKIASKKVSNPSTQQQYKKAAFNGVWAAVILMIFLGILFFIR